MLRVAVMGDTESIKGFSAIGFDTYSCDDAQEAPAQFRRLVSGDTYGVIYLTEWLFAPLEKEIHKLDEQLTPAVIPIPGVRDNTGVGVRRLSEAVERAVGSDILFGGSGD